MIILGLGGILSDAACALLRDGELVAAVEEKKIARRYTTGELPQTCDCGMLQIAGITPDKVDCVALVRPFGELPIRLSTCRSVRSFRTPGWCWWSTIRRMRRPPGIHRRSRKRPFLRSTAPATCVAERAGMRTPQGCGSEKELFYPDSFGDLYGRVTELLGFQANADEHKVSGYRLSGDDRFRSCVRGDDRLGQRRLASHRSILVRQLTSEPRRLRREALPALGMDADSRVPETLKPHVAAGIQRAVENAVLRLAGDAKNVCLAGGLGMNASARCRAGARAQCVCAAGGRKRGNSHRRRAARVGIPSMVRSRSRV